MGDADPTLEEIDALYSLQREEFVAARDKLARRLKREGDPERSDEVRRLRKPTAVAWLANQLARQHPDAVADLIDAGTQLRRAQEAAIAGGDGGALRDAAKAVRVAVDGLVKLAGGVRGAKNAAIGDLPDTLQAAATDEHGQEVLRSGRLVDALDPAGFGDVDVDESLLERADEVRQARDRLKAKIEKLRTAVEEAEAEADRLAEQADEAEETAERLRRQADAAALAAEDARRRLEEAEE